MGRQASESNGPGWWSFLHNAAAAAMAGGVALTFFLQAVDLTARRFPCEKCRKDFQHLLLKYPVVNYQDINNIDGNSPLRWSWLVHNEVNLKLNKRSYNWKTCKDDYLARTGPVCEECAANDSHDHPVTVVNNNNYGGVYSPNAYSNGAFNGFAVPLGYPVNQGRVNIRNR